jgi:GT2 family glycosyltransferase
MKTAVVILNWNTEGFLREFLPGLLRSVEKVEGAEVIVADNASTDGSIDAMKKEFPQVKTLQFEKNFGFTGGYNKAFSQIDSEYFVLINSDIEVTEDWLEPLVNWMDTHPECGACAPKLHSWQDRDRFEYAGAAGGYIDRFGYPFCRGRVLKRLETDKGQYDSPSDVLWATGACLMVRSSVYRDLRGLDERFFAHMEEIDLCWRMQLKGHKVTVVPDSLVYHVGGGTLPATSPFKLFLNYRNNLLMLENNLAATFALMHYRKGETAEKAVAKGMAQARWRICQRKTLDWLSAAVYLATFKTRCFEAVCRAHKEYRKMKSSPAKTEMLAYIRQYGDNACVYGIYRRWIILESLLHGEKTFGRIRKEGFYNI